MPDTDAGPLPETDQNEPDVELADPDDYHRRQRLKEIHKARKRVHKAMDGFDMPRDSTHKNESREQRRKLALSVAMYVSELEPVIHNTDADDSLPERLPWDRALDFADRLGALPADADIEYRWSPLQYSIRVFRRCNSILADVKPLIQDSNADEWEV